MVSTTAPDARLVAPGNLVLAANVRGDTIVDKAFISNVKQHGVIVPLIVEDAGDGTFNVIDGQHRAIAAVEAGLDLVPVIVQPAGDDAARIVEQLIVNDQRTQLTDVERAGGYKQLSLIGVSADQIARRTNAPKKRIELALTVAESPYAVELASSGVTLDHAAAIIEFESYPELAEKLTQAAVNEPARFPHVLAEAAKARDLDRLGADLLAKLAEAGIPVLLERPPHADRFETLSVDELYRDPECTQDLALSPYEIPEGIQHLQAVITRDWIPTLPEPADDAPEPEWDAYNDSAEWRPVAAIYVRGWRDQGLYSYPTNYPSSPSGTSDAPDAGAVEPDSAAIAKAEEEKTARRRVLANNKSWPTAREIRLTWIREDLLQRKQLPDDAAVLVTLWLTSYLPKDSYNANYNLAGEWLDLATTKDWRGRRDFVGHLNTKPADGVRAALAVVLATIEDRFKAKDSWRPGYSSPATEEVKLYLERLETWGYGLSDVELDAIGRAPATKATTDE